MEENEILQECINEETQKEGLVVQNFSNLARRSQTKANIYTNITDKKKLFNLETTSVNNKINDMEGSIIEVAEVVIKTYEKPMKEPIIDEETGEVIKDKEYSMSCVLVDKNNEKYATGSKTFTIQMMRYLEMFGLTEEGFLIKIVKNRQQSGNKTLGFEVV